MGNGLVCRALLRNDNDQHIALAFFQLLYVGSRLCPLRYSVLVNPCKDVLSHNAVEITLHKAISARGTAEVMGMAGYIR